MQPGHKARDCPGMLSAEDTDQEVEAPPTSHGQDNMDYSIG